ncbi:arginine metabolism regulation protein II [Sporothrix eucalyptigena]
MAYSTRSPRLKSVTFTGCWTCRSRKVKCDEREINGCGVCERAGLTCAGFEVSLCWVQTGQKQQQASTQPGPRRRGIKLHRHTGPIMSDNEIMRAISTIDATLRPTKTKTIGPFAVFQAEGLPNDSSASTRETTPAQDSHPPALPAPLSEDAPSDLAQLEINVTPDLSDVIETASSPAISINNDIGPDPIPELGDILSPHFGLAMPLFRDTQTARLMYHFTNHVAELLQPVLHPGNPWRTTYFTFALQGCPDLWLAQTTASASSSNASLSLFHSLLSAAAFHLRNSTGNSGDYHRLALQHRIKALQALNVATPQPGNQQLYLIHLTAMLSLVTVDTMAGEDSDFPVHLKACYQLKKPFSASRMSGGGSANQIYSICRFLTLLARTTSPVIVARPWREPEDGNAAFTGPGFDNSERSVEYMYGITPALGNMLAKTCQMAEHLAYYQQRCEEFPLPLQEACTALGNEIASWAVDNEPFVLIEAEEHSMREIARCQARAFQGAVLIYYCQTLQKYGLQDSISPVAVDVQSQVQVIWAQLTTAEDLKDSYTGGLKRSAPMSWPAFLAACESSRSDRELWVEWWERVNGYHIGNFARQWQIIQDVWNMQDAVEETSQITISWRDALAQTGKLVLPI